MENIAHHEPSKLPYKLLKQITNDFDEERLLGSGFGRVYKGIHADGHVIAVKPYYNHYNQGGFDDVEFQNGIAILRNLRHQNIVQLIGYCHETEEMIVQHKGEHVTAQRLHTLSCFEYFPSGSLNRYISDCDSGLDWRKRYGIIKGICDGLKYLHEGLKSPIIHLDLKPDHILMDEKMMPKIYGLSSARQFDGVGNNTHVGTVRYWPPEYIKKKVISKEFDIFSLGIITLQLMMGQQSLNQLDGMSTHRFIKLAHEKWRRRLQKTVDDTLVEGYCHQVKQCLKIAVKCVEIDRRERPAIGDIIHVLTETEILIQQLEIGPDSEQLLDSEDSELHLEVHPLELQFMASSSLKVARKKKVAMMSSSCSLQLKNKGNDRVAFMLVANSPKRYLTKEPLCGIVPPRCTYTLTLTMCNNKQQSSSPSLSSSESGCADFFTLYSVWLGAWDLRNVDRDSVSEKYGNFFKKAKEEVQEVMLKVICDRPAADQVTSSSEIITTADAQQVSSIDVHPTEPWIVTTNQVGSLLIWNYKTMEKLNSFELLAYESVHVAKFITREKWLIAGDQDGGILVYNYENKNVESFDAHESCIGTLAVHPTSPFVLSSSEDDDYRIKLWDWGNGWKCTRKFGGHTGKVTQVTFNPEGNDNFASVSLDGTVKIWSICSDDPSNIITLKLDEHGLCVDYFTRSNRQHLIVGCKGMIAQIVELMTKDCVHELEGHQDHITVVSLHSELQMLITGSLDGVIRIWNSIDYKLEKIIWFNLGAVYALGCMNGSRRIMVGCHRGIATMDICWP